MHSVLTIAGSDSSGRAGIQADLRTLAMLDVHGATAVTAITAQNARGVVAIHALPADLVAAQIETAAADGLHATKIGMLANAAIVEAVAAAIEELDLPLVVVDPVLVSSSGERLLDDDGVRALGAELLPRARVVTPNIPEAEVLSGRRIQSMDDARDAARRIHDIGAAAVIITGGHGWDEATGLAAAGVKIVDLLFDGHTFHEYLAPRIDSRHTHGTGCTYAAAVAAGLALGMELPAAASRAQRYVGGAIANAPGIGHGRGPIDHFWE